MTFPVFFTMNHMFLKGLFALSYIRCCRGPRSAPLPWNHAPATDACWTGPKGEETA